MFIKIILKEIDLFKKEFHLKRMLILCLKKLGGGVGRRLCMPSYTGTSDSTFKEKKFVLKKLRHHYENVLLFGDIKKLRDTAEELIKNYTPKKNQVNGRIDKETFKNTNGKNVDASFYEQKIEPFLKKKQLGIDKKLEINKKLEIDNELDIDNEKRKEKEIKINKEKDIIKKGNVITKNSQEDVGVGTGVNVDMDVNIDSSSPLIKKTSFWQIYSMRVKKSAHLLNHFDFALILHSFHLHNKDTGIYSSCVKYVEKEIPKMNGVSYVLLLNILSTRLKKNSYNFFFEKMRQNIPNILFDLNLKDIINILNCFYNIELHHKSICDIISSFLFVLSTYILVYLPECSFLLNYYIFLFRFEHITNVLVFF